MSTDSNSHFAYSVCTSPGRINTTKGISKPSTDTLPSGTGDENIHTVSLHTVHDSTGNPVSYDFSPSSDRSVRSTGDKPVRRDNPVDSNISKIIHESTKISLTTTTNDNFFNDTTSTTVLLTVE